MVSLTLVEFADRVNEAMRVIARDFMRHQPSEFYKVKLTIPQLAILDLLNKSGELNMSDMARSMNVTTAAMTGIVERLVRDGYVARASDPDDRRVIKIKLTAKGNSTVKTIARQRKEMIVRIFGNLSQREREEYLRILTRIRENIKG